MIRQIRSFIYRDLIASCTCTAKWQIPCFQEKLLSDSHKRIVPETDTGGQVENTKALERTLLKELGKMVP